MPLTHIIMAAHASTLLLHSLSQFPPTPNNCEIKFDTNSLQVDTVIKLSMGFAEIVHMSKFHSCYTEHGIQWYHAKQDTEYKVSCYAEHEIQSMLCSTWNTMYHAMQNMEYEVSCNAEHGIHSIMLSGTWNTMYHAMQNMQYNISWYGEYGIQRIMICRTCYAEHGLQGIMLCRTRNTKCHATQSMEYKVPKVKGLLHKSRAV